MTTLWICEKPKVARAIAPVIAGKLNEKTTSAEGAILIGNKHIVSWVFGHLLTQVEPDEYDERFSKWDLATLPILPSEWKLKIRGEKKAGKYKPDEGVKKQFNLLSQYLAKADRVVNCGDPDREGQLLVDEILHFCKYDLNKVDRCLINSLEKSDIEKRLNEIKPNKNFENTYLAGLARSRADWLIGMNFSRAATLNARSKGFQDIVTVGRVQSPTLGLVVRRDLEIENFQPVHYFSISCLFSKEKDEFKAFWLPKGITIEQQDKMEVMSRKEDVSDEELQEIEGDASAELSPSTTEKPSFLDSQNRLIDKNYADALINKLKAFKTATVVDYIKERKNETRPMLFNMSGLQKEMGNYGFSAQETLDVTQSLYEQEFLTYPRTDSNFLPTSFKAKTAQILQTVSVIDELGAQFHDIDTKREGKFWSDDKEVEVHHAIIPTIKKPDISSFTEKQKLLYSVVATRFFSMFLPECIADKAKIIIDLNGETFVSHGKVIVQLGWKVLEGQKSKRRKANEEDSLPVLSVGDTLGVKELKIDENKTTPPTPFLESDLPVAMEKIYLQVTDNEQMRRDLKRIGGIGTEATRAKIIEELKRRGYLKTYKSKGKLYITSTDSGRVVIKLLPKELTSAVLTARWENKLENIEKGNLPFDTFSAELTGFINKIINDIRNVDTTSLNSVFEKQAEEKAAKTNLSQCPQCKKGVLKEFVVKKEGVNKGRKFKSCSSEGCKFFEWS